MTSNEVSAALFREANPDCYILTSEVSVALGAAWQVLQAFELDQRGKTEFYSNDSRESTLVYLRSGGEERPQSGIFAVELRESFDTPDLTNLLVSNRNGHGDKEYRATLRKIVETVGIFQP